MQLTTITGLILSLTTLSLAAPTKDNQLTKYGLNVAQALFETASYFTIKAGDPCDHKKQVNLCVNGKPAICSTENCVVLLGGCPPGQKCMSLPFTNRQRGTTKSTCITVKAAAAQMGTSQNTIRQALSGNKLFA